MSNGTIYLGIDPGKNTGFAVWMRKPKTQWFTEITTTDFHGAIEKIQEFQLVIAPQQDMRLVVVIEAANLNKSVHPSLLNMITGTADEKLRRVLKIAQDVGGIRRECELLIGWCERQKITTIAAKPTAQSLTKLDAEKFNRLTGWTQRTNEHSRDAAMLVWGK